ncbi:hypothetical protein ABEB36_007363 [Hypothenemus hampei]|uniref:TATA box-binding protein-associated factor RNA polymerase I subunit B n=1 Tax=Hypothenemus hampei TaxID=57062 RepID=A0ABD1ETS5_HYPHA
MDVFDPNLVCNVCGAADFYKEAGHFYCNECQTQSQQIQDHVFEQDTVALKTTKKIQNDEAKKNHKVLTSWECLNYILKGLTEELIELGAKPILKPVIKCLWMKYLHTCEVFDLESSKPPKISVLGPKKDITILYNVKRTKRKRSRASSTSTTMTLTRQRSNKKRALIQNEYKELSESKNLTQDDMVNDISLSNIKSGSESSEDSNKIHYNRISTKEIRKIMSKQHQKKHTQDLENNLTCHKFRAKTFKRTFYSGPANLTSFTLYSLLYIALLIIKDNIQLGDMFRYIREGHLSFGCFRHFFPSDLPEKALNMPLRKEKLFTSYHFRKRTAKLAQFLQVTKCINTPDLVSLCKRYCTELNLPNEIFYCVEQLIQKTQPKMKVQERTSIIPNYEARIMGMILFVLKLFYGLDGVTEHKISDYTKSKSEVKMFDLIKWLEYLGYRANIMKLYHLPTRFKEEECYVDSDLYLNYWKNQSVKFKGSLKGTFRQTRIEIQNYLQLFEDLIVNDNNEKDLIFEPSFTPFISYNFLLNPRDYFKSIKSVKNGGANDNIFLEDFMYLYNSTIFMKERARNTVPLMKIKESQHKSTT